MLLKLRFGLVALLVGCAPFGATSNITADDSTPCFSDEDCAEGEVCEFEPQECPEGAACPQVASGSCTVPEPATPCYSDDDCAEGEACYPSDPQPSCPEGTACPQVVVGSCGAAQPDGSCTSDADCAPGQLCQLPPPCEPSADMACPEIAPIGSCASPEPSCEPIDSGDPSLQCYACGSPSSGFYYEYCEQSDPCSEHTDEQSCGEAPGCGWISYGMPCSADEPGCVSGVCQSNDPGCGDGSTGGGFVGNEGSPSDKP